MNSSDDSFPMARLLPSSLGQTPVSSLSAASSYSSLVNCDETNSIDLEQETRKTTYDNIHKRSPHSTLLPRHLNKLCSILEQPIDIHGQGNFPTLNIVCKDFLVELRDAFHDNQIDIKDIRLNGGAASYALTNDKSFSYTDIDFIFRCDLSSESTWTQIKNIVCQCLSRQLPLTNSNFSPIIIQTAYVEKIVRIVNPKNLDSWALISLCNVHGQNIELKFVDRMKRQFQFSVDSFQIVLDPLLDFYAKKPVDFRGTKFNRYNSSFPSIAVECLYGSFEGALNHLNRRQIVTTSPERIHGGGLLKYCLLLTRGYRPYDNGISSWQLEKLMCSRFFIDFADIHEQEYKLFSYLSSHFPNDDADKYRYLLQLSVIIERSTVCLMAHERNLTLTLISQLATEFYYRLYDDYQTYNIDDQITTAEVKVPNSITVDVIYHNEFDEWKSLYTPSRHDH